MPPQLRMADNASYCLQEFGRPSAVKHYHIFMAEHGVVNLDAKYWPASCAGSPVSQAMRHRNPVRAMPQSFHRRSHPRPDATAQPPGPSPAVLNSRKPKWRRTRLAAAPGSACLHGSRSRSDHHLRFTTTSPTGPRDLRRHVMTCRRFSRISIHAPIQQSY